MSSGVIKINLLPAEFRRPLLSAWAAGLLFLSLLLLFSFYPLYSFNSSLERENKGLKSDLSGLISKEEELRKLAPEAEKINTQIADLNRMLAIIKADKEYLQQRRSLLTPVLKSTISQLPQGVKIDSLEYKEGKLEIKGRTQELTQLSEYTSHLNGTGLFSEMTLSYEHPSELYQFTLSLKMK